MPPTSTALLTRAFISSGGNETAFWSWLWWSGAPESPFPSQEPDSERECPAPVPKDTLALRGDDKNDRKTQNPTLTDNGISRKSIK